MLGISILTCFHINVTSLTVPWKYFNRSFTICLFISPLTNYFWIVNAPAPVPSAQVLNHGGSSPSFHGNPLPLNSTLPLCPPPHPKPIAMPPMHLLPPRPLPQPAKPQVPQAVNTNAGWTTSPGTYNASSTLSTSSLVGKSLFSLQI